LGLNNDASDDVIKQAYKRLALKFHPDKTQGDDIPFKRINDAYQILKDPVKKQIYDARFQESFNVDILNNMASALMTLFYEKLKEKLNHKLGRDDVNDLDNNQKQNNKKHDNKKNESFNSEPKKEDSTLRLYITVKVDIQELYNSCIKKIIVKVKRRQEDGLLKYESIPLYISLLNYESQYTFEKMGDDSDTHNERGDVVVNIDIISKKLKDIYIDQLVCKYDLHIERNMSLYEYYYGVYTNFQYFNDEIIEVKKNVSDNKKKRLQLSDIHHHNYVHVLKGKGLPYIDDVECSDDSNTCCGDKDDKTIKRGDLYIMYSLTLPNLESKDLLDHENFFKAYFNDVTN
jgi:DnaJ-class molecular chaperone